MLNIHNCSKILRAVAVHPHPVPMPMPLLHQGVHLTRKEVELLNMPIEWKNQARIIAKKLFAYLYNYKLLSSDVKLKSVENN